MMHPLVEGYAQGKSLTSVAGKDESDATILLLSSSDTLGPSLPG
jgi:hypothetical protein